MRSFLKLSIFVFLFSIAFSSCEKETKSDISLDTPSLSKDEAILSFQKVLLTAMQEPELRAFLKEKAFERFTHDYEVVYGHVKDMLVSDQKSFESLLLVVEEELLVSGEIAQPFIKSLVKLVPLLSINVPHQLENWNTETFTPPIILNPEATQADGNFFASFSDGRREVYTLKSLPNHTILTITENERITYEDKVYKLRDGLLMSIAPSKNDVQNGISTPCFYFSGETICYDERNDPYPIGESSGETKSCPRNFGVYTYLTGIRMDNVGTFENFGHPELRCIVLGGNNSPFINPNAIGQRIADPLYTPRRRDVNRRWWNTNHLFYTWYSAYGSILTFRWEEVDTPLFGGNTENITIDISVTFGGQSYGVDATFPRGVADDYIGTTTVDKDQCPREYSVGGVQFRLNF